MSSVSWEEMGNLVRVVIQVYQTGTLVEAVNQVNQAAIALEIELAHIAGDTSFSTVPCCFKKRLLIAVC